MGFLTRAGNAARMGAAALQANNDLNKLKDFGVSRVPNPDTFARNAVAQNGVVNTQDLNLLNKGKGYAVQELQAQYGLNTADAKKVVLAARQAEGHQNDANYKAYKRNDYEHLFDHIGAAQEFIDNKLGKVKNDDYPRAFVDNASYLPNFQEGQGVTSYMQKVFNFDEPNAHALANDLRDEKTAAIDWVKGFAPPTKEDKVNSKKQAQALVDAEISAIKRVADITDTNEAIGLANANRLNNDNYGNVLLENSDYVLERLRQGDENVKQQFINANRDLENGDLVVGDLNTAGLGIVNGGLKYIKEGGPNGVGPARMAGDRVQDLVGVGTFADVYRDTDSPGVVRKEQPAVVQANVGGGPMLFPNQAGLEADMQLLAAEKGIGPRVEYLERNTDGSTVIGMQDVSQNYQSLSEAERNMTPEQLAGVLIKHNIQLAELGNTPVTLGGYQVRGMEIADRHKDNVHVHKMNNRPIQLDFGMQASSEGGGFQGTTLFTDAGTQAKVIGEKASKAMIAAGLSDEGKILNDAVMLRLGAEDYEGALDAAMAGLDIAKRIKGPVNSTNVLSEPAFYENDGSLSRASTDNLLGTESIYSRFS